MSSPHKTTAASPAKAAQVFETVELLENIMLNLGVRDILKAMQATRAMHDTVLGSTKIKISIGLLPNYDCHFSAMPWEGPEADRDFFDLEHGPRRSVWLSPKNKFHGFKFSIHHDTFDMSYDFLRGYEDLDRDNMEEFRHFDPRKILHADFMIAAEGDKYPWCGNVEPGNGKAFYKMGTRVRMLSICQPPVSKLDYNFFCHDCHECYRSGTITASNWAYITLEDLYRGNIGVRKEHRLHCGSGKGKLTIMVDFSARVALRADDPIMAFWRHSDVTEKM